MMRFSSAFFALFLSTALLPVLLSGAPPVFTSPAHPPRVLEIYTSEGCSSCPAADLWLGELKAEPDLWTNFIPVALHVDYWDPQGWKDRMGSRRATVRQRQEAAAGKVYTPGFFLNGVEWRGFFDSVAFPPSDQPETGILTVTEISPHEFVVDYQPKGIEKGPLEVNATLLGMNIEVDVTAGENRGKRLRHDFVALGLRTLPLVPSGGRFTATVPLNNGTQIEPGRLAAAFWITRPRAFAAIQAVGGYLTENISDGR